MSIEFNGDSYYVFFPYNTDWDISANFTIDFWVKLTDGKEG